MLHSVPFTISLSAKTTANLTFRLLITLVKVWLVFELFFFIGGWFHLAN